MPEHASRQDLTPGIRRRLKPPRQGTAGTRQPTRPYAGDTPPATSAPPRNCRNTPADKTLRRGYARNRVRPAKEMPEHASRQDLTPGIRRRLLPPRQGTAGTRQPTRPYAGDTPGIEFAPPRNCRNTPADKTLRRGYAAGYFRPAKELPEHASRQDLTPGIRRRLLPPRQGTAGKTPAEETLRRGYARNRVRPA
jgi:hypothetical protein